MEWWYWLVIGLLLWIGEAASPGGIILFLVGCAAGLVGLAVVLGLGGPLWFQLVAFGVLSLALVYFFRGKCLSILGLDGELTDTDSIVGLIALVEADIEPNSWGYVAVRGSRWKARNNGSTLLGEGSECTVIEIEGVQLKVVPVGEPE